MGKLFSGSLLGILALPLALIIIAPRIILTCTPKGDGKSDADFCGSFSRVTRNILALADRPVAVVAGAGRQAAEECGTMLRVLTSVLLFCTATILYAQTPSAPPRVALEIQREQALPPTFLIVPEEINASGSLLSQFPDRPGAVNDANNRPTAVELDCKLNGDAIAITSTVVFGAFDKSGSTSIAGHPQQTLGDYSVRLNDSIVLEKMADYGLHPWTIKVVPAQTKLANLSRVPSIQIEVASQDLYGYDVKLHNISSRAVTNLVVSNSLHDPNNLMGFIARGSDGPPIIEPGATHEMRYPCAPSEHATSDDAASSAPPCMFVLDAALFADGSFEGDARTAARMDSSLLAEESQRQRIRQLVQSILADPSVPESSRTARIRSELDNLSAQPDPAIFDQLRLKFPSLLSRELPSLNADAKTALANERALALHSLEQFESSHRAPSTVALSQWLTSTEGID